jgi:hypothetical protein
MISKDPPGYSYGGFKTIHPCVSVMGRESSLVVVERSMHTSRTKHNVINVVCLKNIYPHVGNGIWLTKKRSKNITHTFQLLLCIRTTVGSIDHDRYHMVYLVREA